MSDSPSASATTATTARGGRRGRTDRAAGERGPRRRLTVQSWFQLILSVMLVFVLGCAGVGAQLLSSTTHHADELAERIQPARIEMYRLQNALLNQETGVRGFVLTRDERFLDPYTQGLADERAAVERLRELVRTEKALAADLTAMEGQAAAWRRAHADPLIDRARESGSRPGDRALDESKRAFDRLRALFGEQTRHVGEVRDRARAELADIRATRDLVFGVMTGAFVVTAVALAVLLRRTVGRSLRALRTSSQRVADGDFDHRISAAGPADVRAVALSVENMRDRIVAELSASRSREALLRRQTGDLDTQAAELRRSNSELEQFAYVASHDLQEPLRKVASFCQLLEKRYGEELDERGKQYIGFAVDGAKRMQILINDLLTFSRVGRATDDRARASLDDALERALANLSAVVEESGARIERPENLPEVTGNATTLTMLWQNLIGNAVKFRAPDRVPHVTVGVEPDPDGGEPTFCVTDNGIGIPPEFSEKVFVIFQRLHSREAYAGTGIGLALCKKIVEHHGGTITLDTDRAVGARICFTLPGPAAPPTGTAPEGASA
ncbi:MAG TPA: histidine kinase [Streptomyces sp.]|nr:histidine kinase [Streptomyces sp.]